MHRPSPCPDPRSPCTMRCLIASALLLLAVVPARAGDQPRPNTLTPKEIADGWILLFDGETTFGWKAEGNAEVKDGVLILGQDKKTTAEVATRFGTGYEVAVQFQGKGE